jgi:DNA-binding transcriptional regulator GbsR (MarR family)
MPTTRSHPDREADAVRAGFIEGTGRAAESDGLTRIAGRLFGTLLLSDEPCSLDELAEALGASKASVSTDARRLLEQGVVERLSKPGDRRDYYQLAPRFFANIVRHRMERWASLRARVSEARRALPDASPVVRARFDHLTELHDLVVSRVEQALREWDLLQSVDRPHDRSGTHG